MQSKNLKKIFEPESVAVIGASATAGSIGHAILSNIIKSGFTGVLYPVNPKHKSILTIPCFKNIGSITGNIDLAIIAVKRNIVLKIIKQCAQKKVKTLVLITAGFREIGEEGKKLEDQIIKLARKNNISLIGPNCLGIVNTQKEISLNANFSFDMPQPGNLAFISQSGAIGIVAIEYAHLHNIGISTFVSIGNKAVIDESDIIDYLISDENTRVIAMYIEDIRRPAQFHEASQKAAASKKPIVVIKTGTSVRGAQAINSHTGALSSSDKAYDSLFAQCGVVRVESLEELFELAKGFAFFIKPKGNSVAVVTNAGGMGIIATDAVERNKLEMTRFSAKTLANLKKQLPYTSSIHNPVDIIGDADAQRFNTTLQIIEKDKNVENIIVSVTPTVKTDMNAIAATLADFAKRNPDIPILANMTSEFPDPDFLAILRDANIPNYDFPEINVRVLATILKYYKQIKEPRAIIKKIKANKNEVRKIINRLLKEKRNNLTEPETYSVLDAYGLKVADYLEARNTEEVLMAAERIGYPLVLKIISPEIRHKIDIGAVQINIKSREELSAACSSMLLNVKRKKPDAIIHGFLVQKFFTGNGIETIIGSNQVKGFGPLMMFGLGGTFVELFKDVSFRLAPLTHKDALDIIMETKGYSILKGFRGQASYDIEEVTNSILKLSQLVTDFPEITEIEMNPVRVLEDKKGVSILDAKASLTFTSRHIR